MKKLITNLSYWWTDLFKVWRREFYIVTTDVGAMVFFFALPLLYPLVYTLIYNPEIIEEIPFAVVDNCRTPDSRELVRMIDATQSMKSIGYASSLEEARQWHAEKVCYGIIVIPEDYSRKIARGEQAVVPFYSDMSLLMRYREYLSTLTDIQLATGAQIRQAQIDAAGLDTLSLPTNSVGTQSTFLGNPQQGFASFVMLGILILILQQSLILGVTMLGGTARERRRLNNGRDPLAVNASPTATLIGKSLCYVVIYLPLLIYVLHIVPWIFNLPMAEHSFDALLFVLPMLFASVFMGMSLQALVKERETSMLVVVFTSVVFLFLSGLTWPQYAMHYPWDTLSQLIPATWGIEGFVSINSNGATLALNASSYIMLWMLSATYFMSALLFNFTQLRSTVISDRSSESR